MSVIELCLLSYLLLSTGLLLALWQAGTGRSVFARAGALRRRAGGGSRWRAGRHDASLDRKVRPTAL